MDPEVKKHAAVIIGHFPLLYKLTAYMDNGKCIWKGTAACFLTVNELH
jgi:hypothetical protein